MSSHRRQGNANEPRPAVSMGAERFYQLYFGTFSRCANWQSRRAPIERGRRRHQRIPGAVSPGQNLEAAVVVLGDRGATFDPVAAVEIAHAKVLMDSSVMDMPADNALHAMAFRLGDQGLLEIANVVDRVLDLQLHPLRERPVRKTEPAP